MTWESFRRGRWRLVGGALAANALPAIVLAALHFQEGLSPREPSTVQIHYMMMQLNMFMFGATVFAVQGSPSRLYALPVTTATIVAWHLLPAMVVMVFESVLSTVALNAIFDLGWPLWGPALFLAVMLAGINAAIWLTEKSAWTVLAIALVAAAFGFWFKSRFGPLFSPPQRLWTELTAPEVFTMAVAGLLAYAVGVLGVRGIAAPIVGPKSGSSPGSIGCSTLRPRLGAPFSSPLAAQFWFEWRRKGWMMPASVVLLLTFGLAIWLIFSRDPLALMGGVVAGGGILSLLGFVGGVLVGNCGPNDANYEMGQFLATRPMMSSDMARTLLKTAGLSTLMAWTAWAVAGAHGLWDSSGLAMGSEVGRRSQSDSSLVVLPGYVTRAVDRRDVRGLDSPDWADEAVCRDRLRPIRPLARATNFREALLIANGSRGDVRGTCRRLRRGGDWSDGLAVRRRAASRSDRPIGRNRSPGRLGGLMHSGGDVRASRSAVQYFDAIPLAGLVGPCRLARSGRVSLGGDAVGDCLESESLRRMFVVGRSDQAQVFVTIGE